MPKDYHHGVRVIEVNEGTRPIRTISTAVIGLIATGADADEETFPKDTAVLVTNIYDAIGKAGSSGTLKASLNAIADQAQPVCVVVRVEEGQDDEATKANLIGDVDASGKKTGMQALLAAQQNLGVTPRILGTPGHDDQDVTDALVAIAQKLRAFVYAHCAGCETVAEALAYREDFGARELMLIWPNFTGFDTDAEATVTLPAVGRAMGLRAKLDEEVGWHKTISNVPVNGVSGLTKDLSWDLQETGTDADTLNEADITTLVNATGYRFWGSRTCSEDKLFAFENYTRTAQVIADCLAEAHLWAIDNSMHPSLVKDIIEGLNAKGREWVRQGYMLGFNAWFEADINTPEVLKGGKLYIDYDYTPVPPLENLLLRQRITGRYLVDFAAAVAAA